MEPNKPQLIKNVLVYGAILGIASILFTVILFIFKILPVGITTPVIIFIVTAAIYYIAIHISTKKIRDEQMDGFMTYGQGLLIGLCIALIASVISSLYNYIHTTYIDPGYMARVIAAQKEWMVNFMNKANVSADQIDEAMSKIDEKMLDQNPVWTILKSIIGGTIFGFVISLITSAFLKKNRGVFAESDSSAE
jgi:hypothetical protein